MAIAQCPHCIEQIELGATKCPHCHEFIHAETWFVGLRNWVESIFFKLFGEKKEKIKFPYMESKIIVRILVSFIFAIIIGVVVCLLSSLPELLNLQYPWILGFVAFAIALIALTRPLNVQTAVIIAFIALMFNGLGTLWQKENFDLRNRPYIGVLPQYFDMTQDYVPPSVGSTAPNAKAISNDKILKLKVRIENSGEIGAILQDFEYIPFVVSSGHFLDAGNEKIDAINLKKINEHYNVIEWKNAPVFPHSSIEQDVVNSPFGVSDFQRLGGDNVDVYFWLKATYRPIGEKKSFYFWAVIKSKGSSEFQFLNSGDDNRDFPRQYKIY